MPRVSDPQDSPTNPNSQPANGHTILLAEDDPFISRMYETKLTNAGYKVDKANNGRDAYDFIKNNSPDLIMLDINMPELTGFDVVKALISDGVPDLAKKIIILTNSANPVDRKTANDMGLEYVVKADLTPRDVVEKINTRLGVNK